MFTHYFRKLAIVSNHKFPGWIFIKWKNYNSTLDPLIRSPRFLSSWPNLVKICLIINFLMEDLSTWTELLVKDHFLKVILIHHYHRHNHRHIYHDHTDLNDHKNMINYYPARHLHQWLVQLTCPRSSALLRLSLLTLYRCFLCTYIHFKKVHPNAVT